MSTEGGDNISAAENHIEDDMAVGNQDSVIDNENDSGLAKESALHSGDQSTSDIHDDHLQMVMELNFQNEYLKSQILDLKHANHLNNVKEHEDGSHGDVREFHENMESWEKQLLEERQTRFAAEEAVKHLQTVYLEADTKVQELSNKLAEGCEVLL